MSERKTRVWLASVGMGLATSLILATATPVAFEFPPCWPGMVFALLLAILGHGQQGLAPVIAGNSIFYSWIALHVLRAEILARGRLSRHFLA